MSINKVILVGNAGKDPEFRKLDNGTSVAKFTLATSESYKNRNGERVTTTDWHDIVLWRAQADFAEKYIKKGMQLYIEGRIKTRTYDDKDGNKRRITEIYGDVIRLLGKKSDHAENSETPNISPSQENIIEDTIPDAVTGDDLPF